MSADPIAIRAARNRATSEPAAQPYLYTRHDRVEPDWHRFPAWKNVSQRDWESAQWQRSHCVKNVHQLREVLGKLVSETFYEDAVQDQERFATMPLLVPPHLVNTMVPNGPVNEDSLYADPIRRYLLPVASDRERDWPNHPLSRRDSLHEREMWAVESLTHRYPTKVLLEVLATCPQYCGHCSRMDLVGTSTAQFPKRGFKTRPGPRIDAMLDYLRRTPSVRDVVVSGGDVANLPPRTLAALVGKLLEIESIRDIRLASKSVIGLPQHWLQPGTLAFVEPMAALARSRGVQLAVHTHANTVQSVTPLVARAARGLLAAGVREVRNQGVLLRGVNDDPARLLDLCFGLLDQAGILPYYFYMCDMIPNGEHWRLPLWQAQESQHAIMGYLPGFATPRIVCDVPYLGKRWVHQVDEYDRERGISHWSKNYLTRIEIEDSAALGRRYQYYDPISTLPVSGKRWWSQL
jgi:lysine 2,3-aminomutase